MDYLSDLNKFGMNLGLSRMERLLGFLGRPERDLRCIHVAGTNGKGSTCTMLASILIEAGYKVGLFTSPHLERYTERIKINHREISVRQVAEGIGRLRPLVEKVSGEMGPPTEFEVTTALAIWHFATEGVDWAIFEVGLGGDLDSTNLIDSRVTVITNVSMDHTEVLGSDIADIASSKAGIIKSGVPVVTAAHGAAEEVIERRARELGSPMVKVVEAAALSESGADSLSWLWKGVGGKTGSLIDVYGRLGRYPGLSLSLAGRHQASNAALAVGAAEVLIGQGVSISREAIYRGLTSAVWPGRLETIQETPPIIVDGAHNPAGAESLVKAINDYYPGHQWHFVLGVLQDKDQSGIARILASRADSVIVTPPPNPRAGDMRKLVEECARYCLDTSFEPDNFKALKRGLERVNTTGKGESKPLLCITGSLFLIGPARRHLFNILKLD